MKRILALALLAALGFAVAGCGSGKKKEVASKRRIGVTLGKGYTINSGFAGVTITVTRSATVPHVRPGTLIRCKGGLSDRVPQGSVDVGEVRSGSSRRLELSRTPNGTVTVTCK